MEKILTQDFSASWLEEEVIITPVEDAKENKYKQFFLDKKQQELVLETIKNNNITTNKLESLISEIKIESLRNVFDRYLEARRELEKEILNFLKSKWLIDQNLEKQVIELAFKWFFRWLNIDFMKNIDDFSLYNEDFKVQVAKIDDNNEEYSMVIYIEKADNKFYIKDIKIEKK